LQAVCKPVLTDRDAPTAVRPAGLRPVGCPAADGCSSAAPPWDSRARAGAE